MGLFDFFQNACLVVALVAGAGATASIIGWHVDMGNQRAAVFGTLELLADEIQVEAVASQQPVTLAGNHLSVVDGGRIDEAQRHLHNAAEAWARQSYGDALAAVHAGYTALNRSEPVNLNLKMNETYGKVTTLLGLHVPEKARTLGLWSGGSALGTALFATFPPGTSVRNEFAALKRGVLQWKQFWLDWTVFVLLAAGGIIGYFALRHAKLLPW